MSTPQKNSRLAATPKQPSSPLVRTPKHSKQKTTNVTPSKKGQQSSKQSDRSQDLYKRICQGLLDNSRTPPKNKVLTPTKFFKSRAAAPKPSQIYSFVEDPEDIIEDMETSTKKVVKVKVQKPIADSSRKRKRTPQGRKPSKKMKTIVYNNPDSSDEDDDIFISTVKPILSEEEEREMKEILGSSDETEKLLEDEDACCTAEDEYDVVEGNKKQIDVGVDCHSEAVELEEIL